jgi:CRP-like cAMP-binding protein
MARCPTAIPGLLSLLPEPERDAMLASGRRRRFGRGEVLWHEDDPGDTLHLIDVGRVAVRIGASSGQATTVAVLGPGEIVGELAVLGEAVRRAATVTALEPTETLSFDRARVRQLSQARPEVVGFLIGLVVAHLRRVDARLLEALFVPVERRVLLRLLDLCAGAATADVRLTQSDLASVAGTSRATVNRVLRQLEGSGAVELARGRIRVLDRQQLVARAS